MVTGDSPKGFVCSSALRGITPLPSRCLIKKQRIAIAQCDRAHQPDDHIGMIGLFKPLIGRVLATGARLTVVELKAELVGNSDGYCVTLDPGQLSDCTKVISTSTLLLNDTLDRMVACCHKARWFAMVGPSAGCLPDKLFSRGVTLLGGTWVNNREGFIAALKGGESRSDHASKFALTATSYAGWRALIQRACK